MKFLLLIFCLSTLLLHASECSKEIEPFLKQSKQVALDPEKELYLFYEEMLTFKQMFPRNVKNEDKATVLAPFVKKSNALTERLFNLYKRIGIELIKEESSEFPNIGTILILRIPLDLKYPYKSFELMKRLANASQTDNLYFDFFTLEYLESLGVFLEKKKAVHLSATVAIDLLTSEQPDYILWHELSHALFSYKAKKGLSSIYQFTWMVRDEAKFLPGDQEMYAKFLSAEELYNFVRGPHWIMKGWKEELDPDAKMKILFTLKEEMERVYTIADKTSQVVENSFKLLDEMATTKKQNLFGNDWDVIFDTKIAFAPREDLFMTFETKYQTNVMKVYHKMEEIHSHYDLSHRTNSDKIEAYFSKQDLSKYKKLQISLEKFKPLIIQEQREKLLKLKIVSNHYLKFFAEAEQLIQKLTLTVDGWEMDEKPAEIVKLHANLALKLRAALGRMARESLEGTNAHHSLIKAAQ